MAEENRRLIDLCSDFLLLGSQVTAGNVELPSTTRLQEQIRTALDEMTRSAEKAGHTAADIEDTRYAIAAFLDEMIQFSTWPERQQWGANPLQAILFGERVAGIRFFERLEQAKRRSPQVVEVYYACLVLGFGGQYRVANNQQAQQIVEDLQRHMDRRDSSALSVHGAPPSGRVALAKQAPLVWVMSAAILVAIVFAVVLMFVMAGVREDIALQLAGLRT